MLLFKHRTSTYTKVEIAELSIVTVKRTLTTKTSKLYTLNVVVNLLDTINRNCQK